MAKNAKREDVKKKLSESLNYCNSHHIPAQELFESIADRTINNETCGSVEKVGVAPDSKRVGPASCNLEYG